MRRGPAITGAKAGQIVRKLAALPVRIELDRDGQEADGQCERIQELDPVVLEERKRPALLRQRDEERLAPATGSLRAEA